MRSDGIEDSDFRTSRNRPRKESSPMISRKFRVAKLFLFKINYELPGSSTNKSDYFSWIFHGGPHGNPNGFFLDSSQIQLDLPEKKGTESLREPSFFLCFFVLAVGGIVAP